LKTAVLLSGYRYVEAMKSAEAKDSSINYRRLQADRSISLLYNPATGDGKRDRAVCLQADRSISLLYNPATGDGKFSTKLAARAELANGYYEAFPQIDYAQSLQENNAKLAKYGWPEHRGI